MNISEINSILDKFYHKTVLIDLYTEYFHTWIEKGWVTTPLSAKLDKKELPKIGKDTFIDILRQFYVQQELCKKAYASFSPAVQKTLFTAAWYQHIDIPTLEKECGIEIAQRDKQYLGKSPAFTVLKEPFRFFQYRGHYYDAWHWQYKHITTFEGNLYLPIKLCALLQNNLPKPKNYEFHPLKTIAAANTHTASEEIVSQAELYYTYIAEGNIKINVKTGAILTSSIKTMQSYCQIAEFFPSDYTRTAYTTILFAWCDPGRSETKIYTYRSSPDLLKQVVTDFLAQTHTFTLLRSLLPHLKGRFMYVGNEKNIGASIKTVLSRLPRDETWITTENLLDYISFRKINFDIVDPWSASRYLYVEKKGRGNGATYLYDEEDGYKKYLIIPLIKSLMFFLASAGILDIAYDPIDFNSMIPPLHPFDTLKAIRLTSFGQYVLGIKPAFLVQKKEEAGEIILDENTRTTTYNGTNKLIQLTLEKIGTRITETRYQVDFPSLFKECVTIADVKRKIQLFRNKVTAPLPQHWETFFQAAIAQKNPLEDEQIYSVLKIRQDRTLINFIATDEYMKNNTIKAEGYRILVLRSKVSQVKTRLKQAGYFSDEKK